MWWGGLFINVPEKTLYYQRTQGGRVSQAKIVNFISKLCRSCGRNGRWKQKSSLTSVQEIRPSGISRKCTIFPITFINSATAVSSRNVFPRISLNCHPHACAPSAGEQVYSHIRDVVLVQNWRKPFSSSYLISGWKSFIRERRIPFTCGNLPSQKKAIAFPLANNWLTKFLGFDKHGMIIGQDAPFSSLELYKSTARRNPTPLNFGVIL